MRYFLERMKISVLLILIIGCNGEKTQNNSHKNKIINRTIENKELKQLNEINKVKSDSLQNISISLSNHVSLCKSYLNNNKNKHLSNFDKKVEEIGGWKEIENNYGETKKTIELDVNNDGKKDIITKSYFGGSSFGGNTVKIKNKANTEIVSASSYRSFGDMAYIIPLRLNLLLDSNKPFMKLIEQILLPNFIKGDKDPFLTWIISASTSEVKNIQKSGFSKQRNIKLVWKDYNIPMLYMNSYITITNYNKNIFRTTSIEEIKDTDFNDAWLVTNKYNSGVPKYVSNIQGGELFFNNHSVYILKDKRIKYVFINYNRIFNGVSKLRWASIKDVKLKDNYIFIIHKVTPGYDLVVININTGDILFGNYAVDYKLDKNDIYNYSNETIIDYNSIINANQGLKY